MSKINGLLNTAVADNADLDELTALVYEELHRIAQRRISEGAGGALAPTEVINETYLRLAESHWKWNDRNHFMAAAAQIMRRIIVDAARTRDAKKRGGDIKHIGYSTAELQGATYRSSGVAGDVVALEEALKRLERIDSRKTRVIECRFFAGLSVAETAAALEVSPETIMRDWRMAKAWLSREIRLASP